MNGRTHLPLHLRFSLPLSLSLWPSNLRMQEIASEISKSRRKFVRRARAKNTRTNMNREHDAEGRLDFASRIEQRFERLQVQTNLHFRVISHRPQFYNVAPRLVEHACQPCQEGGKSRPDSYAAGSFYAPCSAGNEMVGKYPQDIRHTHRRSSGIRRCISCACAPRSLSCFLIYRAGQKSGPKVV